jgi:hypothetical protein
MKSRDKAAKSRHPGSTKPAARKSSAAKNIAATKKIAPARKPAKKPDARKPATKPELKLVPKVAPVAPKPAPAPAAAAKPAIAVVAAPKPVPVAAVPKPAAPPPRPAAVAPVARPNDSAARLAIAQQAEERRKAATRKLFARLRSLEAIVGADLRKRGSLLLSQAVDQWYAEAISATASDVTITNAARAVISQL